MKLNLNALALIVLFSHASASDHVPQWSDWNLDSNSIGCRLSTSLLASSNRKYEFENTPVHSLHAYFYFKTFADSLTAESDLYKIRFVLELEPSYRKALLTHRVSNAIVNGFEASPISQTFHQNRDFFIYQQGSKKIFEVFSQGDPLDITLIFKSGESREFNIYPAYKNENQYWSSLFQVCTQQHKK